jgi:hypothetical protein
MRINKRRSITERQSLGKTAAYNTTQREHNLLVHRAIAKYQSLHP